MSAIITENFRRNNTLAFIDTLSTSQCYVGIGRSNEWPTIDGIDEGSNGYNVESPLGTFGDDIDVKNNLTTLIGIKTGSYSTVIPKIVPKNSHRHKAYNPFDIDCFYQTVEESVQMYPCYIVQDSKVYLCLREATASSATYSFPASGSISREPVTLADGSIWVYVYSYSQNGLMPIDATQFISVPADATLDDGETLTDISGATGSVVFGFTVAHGGQGYTSATAKYITESGAEVTLDVTVSGGKVTSVKYQGGVSPSSWSTENGYVLITGDGSYARALPNIAPVGGFGANPSKDLPSWYAGVKVLAEETIFDDGAYIPYRQISIIKEPNTEGVVTDSEISLNCLDRIKFDIPDSPSGIITGSLITQASTGAKAVADYYDVTNRYLYYHQNYDTGFIPFDVSTITNDSTDYEPTELFPSEYVTGSGEVLFIENRSKISRTSGQTEEITIIIQF